MQSYLNGSFLPTCYIDNKAFRTRKESHTVACCYFAISLASASASYVKNRNESQWKPTHEPKSSWPAVSHTLAADAVYYFIVIGCKLIMRACLGSSSPHCMVCGVELRESSNSSFRMQTKEPSMKVELKDKRLLSHFFSMTNDGRKSWSLQFLLQWLILFHSRFVV